MHQVALYHIASKFDDGLEISRWDGGLLTVHAELRAFRRLPRLVCAGATEWIVPSLVVAGTGC